MRRTNNCGLNKMKVYSVSCGEHQEVCSPKLLQQLHSTPSNTGFKFLLHSWLYGFLLSGQLILHKVFSFYLYVDSQEKLKRQKRKLNPFQMTQS